MQQYLLQPSVARMAVPDHTLAIDQVEGVEAGGLACQSIYRRYTSRKTRPEGKPAWFDRRILARNCETQVSSHRRMSPLILTIDSGYLAPGLHTRRLSPCP